MFGALGAAYAAIELGKIQKRSDALIEKNQYIRVSSTKGFNIISKPKTIRESLQLETDEWLREVKDVRQTNI